jgi:hypothetical protein
MAGKISCGVKQNFEMRAMVTGSFAMIFELRN